MTGKEAWQLYAKKDLQYWDIKYLVQWKLRVAYWKYIYVEEVIAPTESGDTETS